MQVRDSGLVVADRGVLDTLDLELERAQLAQQRQDPLDPANLGVCWECPRIATMPCPDGVARCASHGRQYARSVLVKATKGGHCTSPRQLKARAKRRAKRKATKR